MARCDRANASIGGMRSRLLQPAGLRLLLAADGLGARVGLLRGGDPELGGALSPAAGVEEVERVLAGRVRADALRLLGRIEDARPRGLVRAVLLVLEVGNLQAALRATRARPGRQGSAALAPSAWLTPELARALAAARSLGAAAAALRGHACPLAAAVEEAVPCEGKPLAGLRLDAALQRAAFEHAFALARGRDEDARVARGALSALADLANAVTLLAGAAGAAGADLVVPGGGVPAADVHALAARPRDELPAALATRLGAAWSAEIDERSLATLAAEAHLERVLARALRRVARAHPLSVAVPIGYLLERRAEARDLALAVRAADARVPPAQLAAWLEPA